MEQQDNKTDKPLSNRDRAAIKDELISALVAGGQNEGDLFGPDGVFTRLKGAVMEKLLEAEMTNHLGHERHERRKGANSRNGHSVKTVTTETGPVEVRVPRDREGTFEPQLIKKRQGRLEGFDEKVLALYGRGMSTRDIQAHLRELYGTDVSHELISKATEGVLELFREWQSRPLDPIYPIVYLDALFVSTRDGGQVTKRAFYTRSASGWMASATCSTFGRHQRRGQILAHHPDRAEEPRRRRHLLHLRRRPHGTRQGGGGGLPQGGHANLHRALD